MLFELKKTPSQQLQVSISANPLNPYTRGEYLS